MAIGKRTVNEVILVGWIGEEPVLKEAKNGKNLAAFNLGTRRVWVTKEGERKEEVQYHKIVTWGKLAERAQKILAKGTKVYIRGYLHNRKIQIEGEEKPRILTEIVANDLLVLSGKKDNSGEQEGEDDGEGEQEEDNENEDKE